MHLSMRIYNDEAEQRFYLLKLSMSDIRLEE